MINFAFFGSSRLSVIVLDDLKRSGFVPKCIITTPDKPQGRKLILTPNVVKQWAVQNKIKVYDASPKLLIDTLRNENCDVFIVASYGKILPSSIINLPLHKTLNIHPSLLPLYRGPSPLPTAMLDDAKDTGVTIMRLDEDMDHGPIVAQKTVHVDEWPTYEEFEEMMALEGTKLLVSILPEWVAGNIKETPQNHLKATFTNKILKEDGHIDILGEPYTNFRKIQAYHEWPQAFFFLIRNGDKIRVKITKASFGNGKLNIEKVIPEGSREMSYQDFLKGYVKS